MFGRSLDPSTPLLGIIDSPLYHQRPRKLSDCHEISAAVLYKIFLEECEFPEHLCSDSHTFPEGARTYVLVIFIFFLESSV